MSSLRERLAALRGPKPEPDPPHVTVPASLVRSAKLASWIALFALIYFLWLYTLDIAKDRAAALHLTHAGQWTGDIKFWFPYIAGFAAVSVGIPYVAKIAIPVFMSLTWKENLWPKAWALFIAMAVSLVVIAGTFTVQGDAIIEKGRDGVIAEQERSDAIATLQRQKANAQAELDAMTSVAMGSRFQAQAARAGVEGWKATIAEAERQRDPMLPQIRRAIGSAASADAIRQRIRGLDDQIGAAPTQAAVAERVETKATGWIQATLDWLEGARAILLSLVMDIVCLLMPWIALRLEQARARQLAGIPDSIVNPQGAPWADEAHMVQDLREEPAIKRQRAEPLAQRVTDAETGEELVKIKPREYWRRTGGKRNKGPVAMDVGPPADVPADEKGAVFATDSRAARVEPTETSEEAIFGAPVQVESADAVSTDTAADNVERLASDEVSAELRELDSFGEEPVSGDRNTEDQAGGGDLLILDATDEQIAALSEEPEPPEPGAVVQLPRGEGVMMDEKAA